MIFISPPVFVKTPVLIALVTMVVGVSDAAAAQSVGLASAVEGRAITNSVVMKLVRIKPGTFTMRQDGPGVRDYKVETHPAEFDRADWDEKPAHPVTITRSFHLAATEVTVGQYRHFDPGFRLGKSAAVEAVGGISWTKAVEFCAWLTAREGRTYRLPTEAEWEYACPAGSSTLFSIGDVLPDGYKPAMAAYSLSRARTTTSSILRGAKPCRQHLVSHNPPEKAIRQALSVGANYQPGPRRPATPDRH